MKPFVIIFALLAASAFAAELQFTTVEAAVLRNGFSLRHHHRQQLHDVTRLYLGSGADSGYVDVPTAEIVTFEREQVPLPPIPAAASADLPALVTKASAQHRIDADLIHSVIQAESSGNSRALSPKGARGLMQLMPATAAELGVQDAFVPEQNIDGGTRYLRELLLEYNGDMAKALAAYNAGPHRVAQYGGVPPYAETRKYVARIITDFNRKKRAQRAQAAKSPIPAGAPPRKAAAAP